MGQGVGFSNLARVYKLTGLLFIFADGWGLTKFCGLHKCIISKAIRSSQFEKDYYYKLLLLYLAILFYHFSSELTVSLTVRRC